MTAPALEKAPRAKSRRLILVNSSSCNHDLQALSMIIAIIEHETGPVRVPKYSKSAIFNLISRLAVVQVINHFGAGVKPNEVEIKFFADRIDQADQVLVLLFRAVNIPCL